MLDSIPTELAARDVAVTVQNNALRIESSVYGARSEVGSVSGEAATTLGFSGTEFERGKDVAGYFLVDGKPSLQPVKAKPCRVTPTIQARLACNYISLYRAAKSQAPIKVT